jgi:hypothetical protein
VALSPIDPDIASELASLGMLIATRVSNVCSNLDLVKETWSERAAIREYLGGHPRKVAEHLALVDTCEMLQIKYRTDDGGAG